MTTNTPTSAPCAPDCDAPSLPPVLVGALMRHHRTLAGLSMQTAADIVETSASRISDLERARLPLPASTARILLTAYGTPVREIREALTFLARSGHQHRLDDFTLSQVWLDALAAGSQSALVYSTDPLTPPSLALAALPAPAASDRRKAPPGGRRPMVLLLAEGLLGQATTADLSHLIRLSDSGAITVHLVPEQLDLSMPALAQYAHTAWGWDGSAADRLRRQIVVVDHRGGAQGSVCNGLGAVAERQLLEEAVRTALPAQWSLHQLRQAARAHQPGRRSPHGRTPTDQTRGSS
ncbi:helix-turn-helix domain-containing protein [Streptomyces sp. NPDC002476]|uniref:helix-turn-helix domain-containing protein n=1 Tax=Streptomyces sp. NPDC002476 TaxID=3364648 RepID=UPI003694BCA9